MINKKSKIYKSKLKNDIKPFFFGGREHLDAHRSGQSLFLPHAKFKQREKASVQALFFCIAVIYMSKDQNGFI